MVRRSMWMRMARMMIRGISAALRLSQMTTMEMMMGIWKIVERSGDGLRWLVMMTTFES
jgi:hypothetical protein